MLLVALYKYIKGEEGFWRASLLRNEKSLIFALTAGQELDLLVVLVEVAIELAIGATAVILERMKIVIVFRRVCGVQRSLLSRHSIQGTSERLSA